MVNPARRLAERRQSQGGIGLALPRLGRIFKGAPKPQKGPGQDLDYFRVEAKDPAIAAAIRNIYSDRPTSFNICLIHQDPAQAFNEQTGLFGQGQCYIRQCQGGRITYERDFSDYGKGRMMPADKPCHGCGTPECKLPDNEQCGLRGVLTFAILELMEQGIWGYFDISLSGEIETRRIPERLAGLYGSLGQIDGIPLQLFRAKEMAPSVWRGKDGKWQRSRQEKSLVDLIPAPAIVPVMGQIQSARATRFLQGQVNPNSPLPQLPPQEFSVEVAPALPSQESTPEDQANLVLLELYGSEERSRFPELLSYYKRRHRITLTASGYSEGETPLISEELPHVIGRICLGYAEGMQCPGMTRDHDADIAAFRGWCSNPKPLKMARERDFVGLAKLWKVEVSDRLAAEEPALVGGQVE
ncbi:MAG: hypothetical protein AAGF75_00695 [Cyanobacteria bacterium P01_H01_bin.130]